jgi:hypothetical protein
LNTLTPRTKLALEIAGLGIVGGITGDALLRAMPWGLNVTIGIVTLVAVGTWLVRRHGVTAGPDAPWLAITALLLGVAFLRRDAEMLAAYDTLALVLTLASPPRACRANGLAVVSPRLRARCRDRRVLQRRRQHSPGLQRHQWRELPQDAGSRHVRGACWRVIAAPLLIVFAALFASADPVFNNVLTNCSRSTWTRSSSTRSSFASGAR